MSTEEAPIYKQMREAEDQIKKQLLFCIPLTLLAVTFPLAAWFSHFVPSGEPPDVWFQRSGSITVLLAVWMEYNLMKVNEHVNPSGSTYSQQENLSQKYVKKFKIAQYIIVILAISGTLIWGYGDLLKNQ
ncbi:hypothetical protein HWQ46_26045 [Shewanella sp. D64]|uniref:hypothetical protein n=1 Tax=unclassified Shewanella TaxID=196818 RepID=UPI0022BA3475|nr:MULTISPECIES: hypothetical protein [unclassified Shewanella]MEC4728978.1 hypothetical protein [Shewanella sp. D64]MEC4740822.1 hypothetical protein [Shewanella sp. E94]WBJ94782.1 hypothetical protein HWQ47_23495 [Shewanella sp. MTB7]